MKNTSKEIVIDFDGTVVKHKFPQIGESIGAEKVLNELVHAGHKLILFTMRSGDYLTEAIAWFVEKQIPLYGIQLNPTQSSWTSSNKCYGHIYIDDAALGCPLIYSENERPWVDWIAVKEHLVQSGILPSREEIVFDKLRVIFLNNGITNSIDLNAIEKEIIKDKDEILYSGDINNFDFSCISDSEAVNCIKLKTGFDYLVLKLKKK